MSPVILQLPGRPRERGELWGVLWLFFRGWRGWRWLVRGGSVSLSLLCEKAVAFGGFEHHLAAFLAGRRRRSIGCRPIPRGSCSRYARPCTIRGADQTARSQGTSPLNVSIYQGLRLFTLHKCCGRWRCVSSVTRG